MSELHPTLLPLAFLVGTWRGEGVGGYPTLGPDFRYGQELVFESDGRPHLSYSSRTWWLGPEGTPGRSVGQPLAREVGYWRTRPLEAGGFGVEVMLAHPFGIAEIYVGTVTGTRVELEDNVLIRTATAREVERSQRLYGLVEGGDLAYAVDMAALGQPLTPHLSARLQRVAPADPAPPDA